MSYTSLLISTCTVERYTAGAADAYGAPVRTWADHLTDQACRLSVPTTRDQSREVVVGAEVVLADYKLFMQDVDVTEQDRILLAAITYEILLVQRRSDGAVGHHKELFLRVVR